MKLKLNLVSESNKKISRDIDLKYDNEQKILEMIYKMAQQLENEEYAEQTKFDDAIFYERMKNFAPEMYSYLDL